MFADRSQAADLLCQKLTSFRGTVTLVLGLPRGGVVVASVVAKTLGLPLDVLVVKKIPSPGNPELALGALAPDGVFTIDWKLSHSVGADEHYVRTQISELNDQIKQKILLYRKGRKPLDVKNKVIIVVDDGAATGATAQACIKWLRKKNAKKIVVALPTAPPEVVGKIKPEVSECIVLDTPHDFSAVGQFYKNFSQVEDSDVVQLLNDEINSRIR